MKLFPFIMSLLVLFIAPAAEAETFELDTADMAPLFQTRLPQSVYQYSRTNQLQDLTITNAAGEQLPYALLPYEHLYPLRTLTSEIKQLSFFPIKESKLSTADNVAIQIEKNAAKTLLDMSLTNQHATEKTVFLVDAGEKHPPLQTLVIKWAGAVGEMLPLSVFASEDLKSWSAVGQGVLLKTAADDSAILQNTIHLDVTTEARYFKIKPADKLTLNLIDVSAEYTSVRSLSPEIYWQKLPFQARENLENGIVNLDFESTGRFPARYLQVDLPENNTLTHVSIMTRSQVDKPWQYLTAASLFRIDQAQARHGNPEILLNSTVSRFWRLQFNQTNGGIGSRNASLSIGWLPHTLVWNARGNAPYTLHIGERQQIINAVPLTALMPNDKAEAVLALPVANIRLTEMHLNPQNIANSWITPPDYKNWILWAGLLLGLLVLAVMAYSLFKSAHLDRK
ncbi:MAG: hypothetical protein CVU29_09775 [Betaproteobacteria bacterium HGW-Betaproteobacteria-22]|nr:MAG: hypothetical protein CVU29_09775 [Betaproteobacteria bacterium HGW-Betaproteobacteria-22]